MQRKPVYVRCTACPETRHTALVYWRGAWLCANCRHIGAGMGGRGGPFGRCDVCWRDGLPLQRHHPGRALWHPTVHRSVCRSCHLVLSARQKGTDRWNAVLPFHDLQVRLKADYPDRELTLGTYELARAWAECRPLFGPTWTPREPDHLVLIPLKRTPNPCD